MLKKSIQAAAIGLGLLTAAPSALAAQITFSFSSFTDGLSVSFSSGGLNLVVDNAVLHTGNPVNIRNIAGGILASDRGSLARADFTFSQDVKLRSFSITNSEDDGDGLFFNMTQGGLTSANNAVDVVGGPFAFSNVVDIFQGGTAIEFLTGDAVGGLVGADEGEAFVLGSITVATVPLPAALPLMAAGLGAFGFIGWRRKRTG